MALLTTSRVYTSVSHWICSKVWEGGGGADLTIFCCFFVNGWKCASYFCLWRRRPALSLFALRRNSKSGVVLLIWTRTHTHTHTSLSPTTTRLWFWMWLTVPFLLLTLIFFPFFFSMSLCSIVNTCCLCTIEVTQQMMSPSDAQN